MKTTCLFLLCALAQLSADSVCPVECSCSPYFHVIRCRKASLTEVPHLIPNLPVFLLDVSHNDLAELRNGSFQDRHITSLFSLYMHGSNLTVIESDAFRGLSECLVRLSLRNNPHIQLPEYGFHLITLMYLFLSSCNLTHIPASFFKGMPDLKVVDLQDNQLSHFDPTILKPRTGLQLEWLQLNDNKFTKLPLELVTNEQTNVVYGGNPFHCDCAFRVAYSVLARRGGLHVTCESPPQLHDVTGTELLGMTLHCDPNTAELVEGETWWRLNRRWILSGVVLVGGVALVAYLWHTQSTWSASLWRAGKAWFGKLPNLGNARKMTDVHKYFENRGSVLVNE